MAINSDKEFVNLYDKAIEHDRSIGKFARKLLIRTLREWLAKHMDRIWVKIAIHRYEETPAVYFKCTSENTNGHVLEEEELSADLWPHGYVIQLGFRPGSKMTVWNGGVITSYTPKEDGE
jgi:hypothetical protein